MKLLFKTKYHTLVYTTVFIALYIGLGSDISHAEMISYKPMTDIPGLSGTGDLPKFINEVYKMLIGIGATFGVLKIAFAGVKYVTSDVVTSKQDAKNDIVGVLKGLAILLIPFIVLNTIYKPLTSLDILGGLNGGSGGLTSVGNAPQTQAQKSAVESACDPKTNDLVFESANSNNITCVPKQTNDDIPVSDDIPVINTPPEDEEASAEQVESTTLNCIPPKVPGSSGQCCNPVLGTCNP